MTRVLCVLLATALLAALGCRATGARSSIDLPIHQLSPEAAADFERRGDIDQGHPWYVRPLRRWKYVVIHHSATEVGSAQAFDRAHRARGWDGLGYHFVITNGRGGPDGAVTVGSRWLSQKHGAHCGGTPANEYNEIGIGICLVGDFTDQMPTNAQIDSLRQLVSFLVRTYGIDSRNVIGHREAPNARTECPGRKLDLQLDEILSDAVNPG